jgi:serine/threonine protein kinase
LGDLSSELATALADRYVLERELGRGGMAFVYLARDLKHGRLVALKTLRPELVTTLGPERFLREVRIAARLQHPHILQLHDSGEANGLLYYVMPYVEGESLRDRLEREGQLPIEDALQITKQVADALAYAHSQGVVHRDIKPENILLAGNHALVADFGIARAITAAGGDRLTETGLAVGTAAYMSPEQAAAESRLDGRSDIYSLGCVLYEMLAGQPPFIGSSAQAVIARKLADPVPPLRTVRESVPLILQQIVHKSLARTPADRFATAASFAEALAQVKTEATEHVPWPAAGSKYPSWHRTIRKPRVLISLGAALALIGLVDYLWSRESKSNWARMVAVPRAMTLNGMGQIYAAFRLLRQAESHLPDDPIVQDLVSEWTAPVSVRTTPAGADVYVRDFFDEPGAWEFLGTAPLDGIRLPLGNLVWRITLPGFQTQELLGFTAVPTLRFSLPRASEVPPGMVQIKGGPILERFLGVPAANLEDYWIDKYEITNRQFRKFIDDGGYERREYWVHPLVRDGVPVTWETARGVFRDRTGRVGPATWEAGIYADGQENYPVSGVSWYEAAAYCASVGKQLPTVYHWYHAAELGSVTEFARFGNFQADGPTEVGHPLRLGGNGTYDMAGNVKEWAWNQGDPERRYVLGGGWNEPSYQFRDYDAQRPFDRQPTYGIRCAKYLKSPAATLMSPVKAPSRKVQSGRPLSDEVFAAFKSLYGYDRTPLQARVDSVVDRFGHWRVEWVSFAAAYGSERVPALLYLPKNAQPPYHTVVYFPGANAFFEQQPSAAAYEVEGDWFLFLVRSGRAVLFPLYKGSYERHVAGLFTLPHVWRDLLIQGSKDIGRAIDYIRTRPDLDPDRMAYLGLSMGAAVGPIMTAMEPRFRASVLIGGGLYAWERPPESEAFNFLPRVKVPTLMINGRHDFFFPLETSQLPMFRLLGTPSADKRHRVFESGHVPTERQEVFKEVLDWFDRYLGPVNTR